MPSPPLPTWESCGRGTAQASAAVEFPLRRDAYDGSPLSELLVGHVPRGVRFFDLAPIEPSSLLGRREVEVAHLHGSTEVGSCLT